MTTGLAEEIRDYQFYFNFVHQLLTLLFSMDIGHGPECDSYANPLINRYQAEQNIIFPPYLDPMMISFCRCWYETMLCNYLQWQLTEEQQGLWDKLNLIEERFKQYFYYRKEENIVLGCIYSFAFLAGTTGEQCALAAIHGFGLDLRNLKSVCSKSMCQDVVLVTDMYKVVLLVLGM